MRTFLNFIFIQTRTIVLAKVLLESKTENIIRHTLLSKNEVLHAKSEKKYRIIKANVRYVQWCNIFEFTFKNCELKVAVNFRLFFRYFEPIILNRK